MPNTIVPDLDISIVIPVYNERDNLVPLEEKLETELSKLSMTYEIILVDDGSTDGSPHIINSIKKNNPRLKLIRFGNNHGQSAAFAAGFKAARGKIFVTLDADLQNNPADIPLLLEKMEEFDVVCGWRFKRNDPWIKRVSSKIGNAVRNSLSQEEIADTGCSLKAFRRECFDNVKLFKGMHRFFPTLMKMEGFKVTQVKVSHHPRLHGESKYNIRNRLFSSLHDLMAIRWMKKRHINYDIIQED
ncbi:MAG: glycosyltransferase family 2 protein [Nitrospina sp.]|jgi:glycosyltransferase involved in cell wall biosynthesis|nr:glycosyltransferase family 2 protein [Nitrospina sp.]MBT6718526.1 glycosyltransferase family 2 protein [Nitrospina sp.]